MQSLKSCGQFDEQVMVRPSKDLQLMLPFSTPPSDVTTSNNKKR